MGVRGALARERSGSVARKPPARLVGRCSGFTLIELIVAMTLFALLAWTAYAGLRVGARTWEAGNGRTQSLSDMRVALSFVERYLGGALPLASRAQGRWHVEFEGEDDRIAFMTEMGANLGVGGVYRMTLAVEDADEGKRLVMRRVLLGAKESELAAAEPEEVSAYFTRRVLAEGLDLVSFEYYGTEDDVRRRRRATPQWRDRWRGRRALPSAVRVRIEAGGQAWPELVTRLQREEVQFIRGDGGDDDPDEVSDDESLEDIEAAVGAGPSQ